MHAKGLEAAKRKVESELLDQISEWKPDQAKTKHELQAVRNQLSTSETNLQAKMTEHEDFIEEVRKASKDEEDFWTRRMEHEREERAATLRKKPSETQGGQTNEHHNLYAECRKLEGRLEQAQEYYAQERRLSQQLTLQLGQLLSERSSSDERFPISPQTRAILSPRKFASSPIRFTARSPLPISDRHQAAGIKRKFPYNQYIVQLQSFQDLADSCPNVVWRVQSLKGTRGPQT